MNDKKCECENEIEIAKLHHKKDNHRNCDCRRHDCCRSKRMLLLWPLFRGRGRR